MYAIVTNVVKPASNSFLTDVLFDFNENSKARIEFEELTEELLKNVGL